MDGTFEIQIEKKRRTIFARRFQKIVTSSYFNPRRLSNGSMDGA